MSVGHVARALESNGIATVVVAVKAFQHILEEMSIPRLIVTPFTLGRPLGYPGNREMQRHILIKALEMLERSTEDRPNSLEISVSDN